MSEVYFVKKEKGSVFLRLFYYSKDGKILSIKISNETTYHYNSDEPDCPEEEITKGFFTDEEHIDNEPTLEIWELLSLGEDLAKELSSCYKNRLATDWELMKTPKVKLYQFLEVLKIKNLLKV
jgi:hypothetical protein